MMKLSFILFSVATILNKCVAEDSWSFVVLADWHGGESFAIDPGSNSETWAKSLETLHYIKKHYGGESIDLMVLPGDTQNGKWDTLEFGNKLNSALSPPEAVLKAGRNCYTSIRDLFSAGGFDTLLLAIGDHELGGNSWRVGSNKVLSLPQYRQGFIESFNKDISGNFIFNETIGDIISRPIGTVQENTSYAYRHKNSLFITVDAFKQVTSDNPYLDRTNGAGGEGVVTCSVTGRHLNWFELILREARKDKSIKHIFVQSHLPILQPVRKVVCSGQFMDFGEESEFWKLMKDYAVDVYFAGEVHANTATKSNDSNLVQVVSRGNMFNNFLKIQVSDNTIDISSYNEIGDAAKWNNNYAEHGRLTIDKSTSLTKITSSGALKLLDRNAPLIHFNFENVVALKSRQVLGMVHDDFDDKLVGDRITVRGVTSTESMPNWGEFGQQFDAQIANIELVPGKVGTYAASFIKLSRFSMYGTGPSAGGNIISFSAWIKTTQSTSEMILIHYGSIFGKKAKSAKDFFTLTLDRGSPKMYTNVGREMVSSDNINIADGIWHHIGVSMPSKSCLLGEVQIFLDGNAVITIGPDVDKPIFTTTSGRLSVGSFGYSSAGYDDAYPDMKHYIGLIDDLKVWSRPLQASDLPMKKKTFNISDGYRCNRRGIQKTLIRANMKRCKKRCTKDATCFGFELRQVPEGRGKPKCFMFHEKPTIGDSRSQTKCAIVT